MRALCFKVPGSEAYQCSDTTMAAPPWTTLRDFEYASFLVKHEEDDAEAGASYLEIKGWRLSPAYDINPSPDSTGLSLAIDEHDNSLTFAMSPLL